MNLVEEQACVHATKQFEREEPGVRVGCRVAEQQDSVATVLAITNFISLFLNFVFYFFVFLFQSAFLVRAPWKTHQKAISADPTA